MNNSYGRNTRFARQQPPQQEQHAINHRIRVPQIRLIDSSGNNQGVVSVNEAQRMADDEGLDLVVINADATPPVAKIIDYGKFLYQQKIQKKDQAKKSRESAIVMKEIQLRPVTGSHDVEIKLKHAKEWLEQKNRVKLVMKFRGREQHHTELGFNLLKKFIDQLGECKIEQSPEMNGRQLIALISPGKV
jgi:translation initiation factor IF-3